MLPEDCDTVAISWPCETDKPTEGIDFAIIILEF
jgi:hypothetical protein